MPWHRCHNLQFLDQAYRERERICFGDDRFFQDLYLADPGVLLVPSHLGKKPLAGMHGYSCDHEDSNATFITNDPDAAPQKPLLTFILTCAWRLG